MKLPNWVRWLLAGTLPIVLVGCFWDTEDVIKPTGAVHVPGVAGAWATVGSDAGPDLYIWRTGTARYAAEWVKDRDQPPRQYRDIFFLPLPGTADAYLVSALVPTAKPEERQRLVVLAKVRSSLIELRTYTGRKAEEDAKRAGVAFEGVQLGPGAQAALMTYYGRRASEAFDEGSAFRRLGWVSTSNSKDMDVKAADVASAAGNHAEALRVLWLLSNGGHAEAQFRLAGMYAQGKNVEKSADTAIMLYKSAHQSGQPQAAGALANFLASSGLSGQPGYEEARRWYAIQSLLPEQKASALTSLRNLEVNECKKRAQEKRVSTDDVCADTMVEFSVLQARIASAAELTAVQITETKLMLEAAKAEQRKIQREIDEKTEQINQNKKRQQR